IVPGGSTRHFAAMRAADCTFLRRPVLDGPADAIVVDLHHRLPAEWVRFLADCSLKGIPTYHAAVAYEALTGRLLLGQLDAGLVDDFRISPIWAGCKRLLDIAWVVCTLPILGPVMLLTALLIKLESPGPVFFVQE